MKILNLHWGLSGNWVAENTKPCYTPLIEPTASLGRYFFWSSRLSPPIEQKASHIRSKNKIEDYKELGFDITQIKISNKRQA